MTAVIEAYTQARRAMEKAIATAVAYGTAFEEGAMFDSPGTDDYAVETRPRAITHAEAAMAAKFCFSVASLLRSVTLPERPPMSPFRAQPDVLEQYRATGTLPREWDVQLKFTPPVTTERWVPSKSEHIHPDVDFLESMGVTGFSSAAKYAAAIVPFANEWERPPNATPRIAQTAPVTEDDEEWEGATGTTAEVDAIVRNLYAPAEHSPSEPTAPFLPPPPTNFFERKYSEAPAAPPTSFLPLPSLPSPFPLPQTTPSTPLLPSPFPLPQTTPSAPHPGGLY